MTMASLRCVRSMRGGLIYRRTLLYMDVPRWQRWSLACGAHLQKYSRNYPQRCPWKSRASSPRFHKDTVRSAYDISRYRHHHLKRLSWMLPSASSPEDAALGEKDLPLSPP